MPEINLTQQEAETLIKMEKERVDDNSWEYPTPGTHIAIPISSIDKHENFFLDISRGGIELSKATHQNRARQVVVLLRLDCGGSPHQNPDGTVIPCPHIHEYREGFGDKWAHPAQGVFANTDDMWQTLHDFMDYCSIINPPVILKGLFV